MVACYAPRETRTPLPTTGGTKGVFGLGGTVEDASITAEIGLRYARLIRYSTILANVGVQLPPNFPPGDITMDDDVVQLVAGSAGMAVDVELTSGIDAGATLTLRHDTLVSNGDPGSVGVRAYATPSANPRSLTVNTDSTIVHGFGTDLSRTASSGGGQVAAQINLDYSDYDPMKTFSQNTGSGASGSISPGLHNVNVAPGYLSPTDVRLAASSPLIDIADPAALAADEPGGDLNGDPRVVDGNGD